MFWRVLAVSLFWIGSVHAQDRDGNDTASDWVVTQHLAHGIWEAICDERASDRAGTKRCYIRVVEVFSKRPRFGALFFFLTTGNEGPEIEFGIEPGTLFKPGGFRVEDWVGVTWQTKNIGCLTGLACRFKGRDATPLITALQEPGALVFEFTDRHGQAQMLNWPTKGFAEALVDFQDARARRGL